VLGTFNTFGIGNVAKTTWKKNEHYSSKRKRNYYENFI
jgi:hypothetical protein